MSRLRILRDLPPDPAADFVLYWMTSARRSTWNFALDRAVHWCRELRKPLVVLEPLRAGYRYASDRFHSFVLEGMADNGRAFDRPGVRYLPYVERKPDDGKGLLAALSSRAAVVVADDSPAFFLPRMLTAAATQVERRFEAVDGNGLLPIDLAGRAFPTAYLFRRHLQKSLPAELATIPKEKPLDRFPIDESPRIPRAVSSHWRFLTAEELGSPRKLVASLPVDHSVAPSPFPGGSREAGLLLRRFVKERLPRYAEEHSDPDADVASGLSPYLHFGHVSAHEVALAVLRSERWTPDRLGTSTNGAKEGWWGASANAEAFLDQLVTWRELGFGVLRFGDRPERWKSLPDWARATLEKHAKDPRPEILSAARLESADSPDELWNAAQRQLVVEGRIPNYLRMIWGKRLLEWTRHPKEAMELAFHLNDKYATDGRDPNSISGITWCFGRHDRPWAPERPIFGSVRYMSSANTRKKLRMNEWLATWSGGGSTLFD